MLGVDLSGKSTNFDVIQICRKEYLMEAAGVYSAMVGVEFAPRPIHLYEETRIETWMQLSLKRRA